MTEVNVKASFVFEDVFSSGISGIADVKKKHNTTTLQSAVLLSVMSLLHILSQVR